MILQWLRRRLWLEGEFPWPNDEAEINERLRKAQAEQDEIAHRVQSLEARADSIQQARAGGGPRHPNAPKAAIQ